MKSPKLYRIIKLDLKQVLGDDELIISKKQLKRHEERQQDNMLFRQVRLITGEDYEFNRYVLFLNCKGYKMHEQELREILRNGFVLNGTRFVVTEKSASMSRNACIGFVDESISEELDTRITMGVGLQKTVLAKYLAYRGLFFSSCFCVENWKPNIIVVDDYSEILPNKNIKYVVDVEKDCINKKGEPYVWREKGIEEGFKDVKLNLWDGCGIHSPEVTQYVKDYIDCKETPTSILWRIPYMKGMTHEIDFKKWFRNHGKSEVTDIWGIAHNIEEVDMIVTCSFYKGYKYFKKYGDYRDWQEYWTQFDKFNHCIGVTIWNYDFSNEPIMTKASYQILQDLNLPFDEFIKLSDYTTEWIDKIINGDPVYTYCFLGMFADRQKPSTNYMKAVLKNPEMLKEERVRDNTISLLRKNIDDMKCGKLYLKGSFRFVVSDLIMFLEYLTGMPMVGALTDGEFYSKDLNGVCQGERIIERNPHISQEEHLILNGVNNHLLSEYCGHLQNICMLNGYNISLSRLNGADEDGDRVFVIDSDIMKDGIDRNLPVVIDIDDKITALEEEINKENIINCQIRSMVSLVGEISNYATCYHNKKAKCDEQQKKYLKYINLLSVINGKSIDYSKTGVLWYVPKHIAKYAKPFPYFLKYVSEYYATCGSFNKTHSNMNRLAFSVEKWEKEIRFKRVYRDFKHEIMVDGTIPLDEEKLAKLDDLFAEFNAEMLELHKIKTMTKHPNEYISMVKNKDGSERQKTKIIYDEFFEGMTKSEIKNFELDWNHYYNLYAEKAKKICPDKKELANLAVKLCYEIYPKKTKKFMWCVAGDGIVENISQVPLRLPIESKNGKYEYLGKYYTTQEVTFD